MYNAAKSIECAVLSVVQLKEVCEILLTDDGSTDETKEICLKLAKKYDQISYYSHDKNENLGAGPTRNLGIKHAKYDYIAFLDVDDAFLNYRFKKDQAVYASNPTVDVTLNCVENVILNETDGDYFSKQITISQKLVKNDFFKSFIGLHPWYGDFHLNGITVKKELLDKYNIRFSDQLRLHQDTLFLIQLIYYGNFQYSELESPVALRYIHSSNRITDVHKNSQLKVKNKIAFHKELSAWAVKEKIQYKDNIRLNYLQMSLRYGSDKIQTLIRFGYYYIIYQIKKLVHV
jgi:glycosyltransferase involved in cell wall biosynthesis